MDEQPISKALRAAIEQAIAGGLSGEELARRSRVAGAVISRFRAGSTVTLTTADRLAQALGLRVRMTRTRSKKGA